MKFTRWTGLIALSLAILLVTLIPEICAADDIYTPLATWDSPPNPTAPHVGEDFDPTLATNNTAHCSGCWYGKNTGSGITYSQSTGAIGTHGVTQGTGALQADIVGKGSGGSYSATINGAPFPLKTHFDYPLIVTYSNNPAANGGVLDPRFTALQAAINNPVPQLFSIDFDITYDVAEMRSIPWQPPVETVNPGANDVGKYPQRFFWVGMYGNANDTDPVGGFQFLGFDANTINPFDKKWDNNLFPVFHASFPLSDFTFQPNSTTTFYQLGILYNSVFGTSPASSNTSAVHIYFDNLRLRQIDPVKPIDFNDNGVADPGDWSMFMSQFGKVSPTVNGVVQPIMGDLVGNFGTLPTNGVGNNKVDFADLQEFQRFYKLANPGVGAGALPWAGGSVPEPGTFALAAIAIVGLVVSLGRRLARPAMTLGVGLALACVHHTAQAQLLESFETFDAMHPQGKWGVNPGADPGSSPVVALDTIGATDGTHSLKITAHDTSAIGGFSWNAATTPDNYLAAKDYIPPGPGGIPPATPAVPADPAFLALAHAVRVGAENYNLLIDTTFNPADLPGVNSLQVTFGLNFTGVNAGLYSGETDPFTTTTTVPLSMFNLPDTVDQGVNNYGAQIGFTATADVDPFSVYIDNIRLVQISTPDLLTLQIDRNSGAATLKNLTANPISWNYLELKSKTGSLNPVGWSSLHDQNADGVGTWIEAGGSSSTDLVEASLLGSHTLAPGDSLPLGNLYNPGATAQDVGLMIRKAAGPTNRTYDQNVSYIGATPTGVAGDYNQNGIVDAADYTIWRDHLGSMFPAGVNEGGISPGVVDQADYTFWKSRFGATSGSGSLGGGAVPEPSTLLLCLCGVFAAWAGRRTGIV